MGNKATMTDDNEQQYVSAEELFTDREEPRKAFWDIYNSINHDEYDIITYYGIGGIGKTSLLKKLCRELEEKTDKKKMPNYAFFSFEGNSGKEEFLFSLSRQMMFCNKKLSFPLFDTALIKIANEEGKDLKKFEEKRESLIKHPLVEAALKMGGQAISGLDATIEIVEKIWSFASSKIDEKEREIGKNANVYNEIKYASSIELRSKLHDRFNL